MWSLCVLFIMLSFGECSSDHSTRACDESMVIIPFGTLAEIRYTIPMGPLIMTSKGISHKILDCYEASCSLKRYDLADPSVSIFQIIYRDEFEQALFENYMWSQISLKDHPGIPHVYVGYFRWHLIHDLILYHGRSWPAGKTIELLMTYMSQASEDEANRQDTIDRLMAGL